MIDESYLQEENDMDLENTQSLQRHEWIWLEEVGFLF